MIRRDGNILEAGKVGGIPLGIVEYRNSIKEDFFREAWFSFIRPGGGAGESTNKRIW
jgi:hypothetical protein